MLAPPPRLKMDGGHEDVAVEKTRVRKEGKVHWSDQEEGVQDDYESEESKTNIGTRAMWLRR